jgi:hypothetical protein
VSRHQQVCTLQAEVPFGASRYRSWAPSSHGPGRQPASAAGFGQPELRTDMRSGPLLSMRSGRTSRARRPVTRRWCSRPRRSCGHRWQKGLHRQIRDPARSRVGPGFGEKRVPRRASMHTRVHDRAHRDRAVRTRGGTISAGSLCFFFRNNSGGRVSTTGSCKSTTQKADRGATDIHTGSGSRLAEPSRADWARSREHRPKYSTSR